MIFFLNLIGDSFIAEDATSMKKYFFFPLKLRQNDHITFLKALLQPRILISLKDVSVANYMPFHFLRLGTWAISTGVKPSEREDDYSFPSSANFKNGGATHPLPKMSSQFSA
jgi:hypothetical protein